jgi:hypothetical protein
MSLRLGQGLYATRKITYEQFVATLPTGASNPNHSRSLLKGFRYLTEAEIVAYGGAGESFEDLVWTTACINTRIIITEYRPDPTTFIKNQVLVAVYDGTAPFEHYIYADASFGNGDLVPAKFVPIESPEAQYGYVRRDTSPASIKDWHVGELSIWAITGSDQFATAKQAGGPFPAFTGVEDAYWLPAAAPVVQPAYDDTDLKNRARLTTDDDPAAPLSAVAGKADLDPDTGKLAIEQQPDPGYGIVTDNLGRHAIDDGAVYYDDNLVLVNKRVIRTNSQIQTVSGWTTVVFRQLPKLAKFRSRYAIEYAVWQDGGGGFVRAWYIDPATGNPAASTSTVSPTTNKIDPLELFVSVPTALLPNLHVYTKDTLYDDTDLRAQLALRVKTVNGVAPDAAGNVQVAGGGAPSPVGTIDYANEVGLTAATTLDATAFYKSYALSGNSFTLILPPAAANAGKLLAVRARSSATDLYTIQAAPGETINGVTSRSIWAQEAAVLLATTLGWTKIAGKSRPMSLVLRCDQNNDTIISPTRGTPVPLPFVGKQNGPDGMAYNGQFRALRAGTYGVAALGTAYLSGGNGNAEGVSLVFKNGGSNAEAIAGPQMVANTSDWGVQFSAIGQMDMQPGDTAGLGVYLYVATAKLDRVFVGNNPKLTVTEQPDW